MIRFAGIKFQPVQPGQISTYDYLWILTFLPALRDSFPLIFIYICMHFLEFFFVSMSVHKVDNP